MKDYFDVALAANAAFQLSFHVYESAYYDPSLVAEARALRAIAIILRVLSDLSWKQRSTELPER